MRKKSNILKLIKIENRRYICLIDNKKYINFLKIQNHIKDTHPEKLDIPQAINKGYKFQVNPMKYGIGVIKSKEGEILRWQN